MQKFDVVVVGAGSGGGLGVQQIGGQIGLAPRRKIGNADPDQAIGHAPGHGVEQGAGLAIDAVGNLGCIAQAMPPRDGLEIAALQLQRVLAHGANPRTDPTLDVAIRDAARRVD